MDDYRSYIKYKKKYITKKLRGGGGEEKTYNIGINYEGGKIIRHILENYKGQCIGYANVQIVMDAPYAPTPRVAPDNIRGVNRSEVQFDPECDSRTIHGLNLLFDKIDQIQTQPDFEIIIQVARGKSAQWMINDVLNKFMLTKKYRYRFVTGYRRKDYFKGEISGNFIFINIGMFAVLDEDKYHCVDKNNNEELKVGQICNPIYTYDINRYINGIFYIGSRKPDNFKDESNLLNGINEIKPLTLFGIDDGMPFILPTIYMPHDINNLRNLVNQNIEFGIIFNDTQI